MKFCRHFAVVVMVVAVIVAAGLLWAHASGGGTGAAAVLRRSPPPEELLRAKQIRAGVIRVHPGGGFNVTDTGDLIRTLVIEAAMAAVVITVSAVRRHLRRLRRAA